MEQQKEFEVTGVSRSGRVRKKSSKLFDFQSPDEVERRKSYKRSASRNPIKYAGRGRPSLAALRARRQAAAEGRDDEASDMPQDDDDADMDNEASAAAGGVDMDVEPPAINTDEDDDENMDDVLPNANSDTDDDGFGELVADLVGTEGGRMDRNSRKPDSKVRKSLYMTEKRLGKDGRVERKDKGKSRYTAYSLWAREYRKSSKYVKEVDFTTARRELWANVSNKEKNNWRRKAKIQATKAKAMEKSGFNNDTKKGAQSQSAANPNANSTFINRPTTSRTRKLAEDKQKAAKEDTKPATSTTPRKTRNNSYNRKSASTSAQNSNKTDKNSVALYGSSANGSTSNYNKVLSNSTICNVNTPLPTIEPIDAAAHLKLLGESLTVIGDHLKEHEGQIAVSGSLSVLLDSLLCSLGALSCLMTCVPGLEKKPKLRTNLATTLDNIAYVMPGL